MKNNFYINEKLKDTIEEIVNFSIEEIQKQKPLQLKDISCPHRLTMGNKISLTYYRVIRLMVIRELLGFTLSSKIFYQAGKRIGNRMGFKSLDDLVNAFSEMIIGKTQLVEVTNTKIVAVEDECGTCSGLPKVGEPLCFFEGGFIAGGLESIFDKDASVVETKCWGLGDQICQWEATLYEKGTLNNNHDIDKSETTTETVANLIGKAVAALEFVEDYKREKEINLKLRKELEYQNRYNNIVASNTKMKQIFNMIDTIAGIDSTVLIQGESGTGKELIARAIYEHSPRAKAPFVVANCCVFSETLLESELFGHEQGAFTGAIKQKIGRFESAHKGVIFLDEIGDLSSTAQLKLLRVLQERSFERVGGNETIHTDVRIVAATNKNLAEEVKRGKFREDLYYRLNVIPIHLPPLRERKDDIPLLCINFMKKFSEKMDRKITHFSSNALKLLMNYTWPGNVRELENMIERAVALDKDSILDIDDFPSFDNNNFQDGDSKILKNNLIENEKTLILETLKRTSWNKHLAAKELGINRSSLYSKLKKHNIAMPK